MDANSNPLRITWYAEPLALSGNVEVCVCTLYEVESFEKHAGVAKIFMETTFVTFFKKGQ